MGRSWSSTSVSVCPCSDLPLDNYSPFFTHLSPFLSRLVVMDRKVEYHPSLLFSFCSPVKTFISSWLFIWLADLVEMQVVFV